MDTTSIQAYDEYDMITKQYEDNLLTIQRAVDELADVRKMLTKEYEAKIQPLMPYVNEKLEEYAEIQRQKYGEEQREQTALEKDAE